MAIGSFCLVLHSHLPYVLRHGTWPHGEDWLYEAAAETYLPLLALIDECQFLNAAPKMTVGLTPVLLEQLAHDDFKRGFVEYLHGRIAQARADKKEFESWGHGHLQYLASRWDDIFSKLLAQFNDIGRDIPKAFAQRRQAGLIDVLTSAATHGYLPLLYEDSCIRGQFRAGMASSKRILGFAPGGAWLPECAYRPAGPWHPPINWASKQNRIGIEYLAGDEGITHFFVEQHLIRDARSEWVNNGGHWQKVDWSEADKYPSRGWRSVHEPFLSGSDGLGPGSVAVLARDIEVCEQVWSGTIGYPAKGTYLEFHKRHGARRGLRYWKITGKGVDLGQKDIYYPDDVQGSIFQDAQHFCDSIKRRLWDYHNQTGRHGVVVASFDSELFGHWWFEGLTFLRDVVLTLNASSDVDLQTTSEFLAAHPPDKSVSMYSGSWGESGDHRVWTNDKVNWMWDIEYRCEALFGRMTYDLPWRTDDNIKRVLEKAGRELLLLQASDWQFIISRGQAIDYGIKRFIQHVSRFETLIDLCDRLANKTISLDSLNEVERHEIMDADIHDVIFPNIDLNWWRMS